MKTTDKTGSLQEAISFRESIVPLILRIIGVELSIAIIHSLLDTTILTFGMGTHGAIYSFFMAIVPHLLNTVLIVWLMGRWATTSYVIKPGELVIRAGILRIHESSFAITNFENVSISQSLTGRICNYGTLHVSSPLFKKDLRLGNVHNPAYYASLLQETETPVSARSFLSIATK